ncbi:hypothetical protein Sjap_014276 [Stephania japonica]|uniref:Transcription factor Iwr1 domain-containing protein n=1 Tax=Stephania japonica TaxID=461633 RepID=A0AAP0NZU2_9MAGN
MADAGESSSSNADPSNPKPVIVRVKRKPSQSPLDAFWVQINERPLKRQLLDLKSLSLSDAPGKEECKLKKVLVQHVETVSSSEASIDLLQSFVSSSADAPVYNAKVEERRKAFKHEDTKQDQLLSKVRQNHENLVKNARFEQIWKRRKEGKDTVSDDSLREICHLYDVVRVDPDEEKHDMVNEAEYGIDTSLEEDNAILCNYLPLIREFLPSAAVEIESDLSSCLHKGDYVYDLYAVQSEPTTTNKNESAYPLVQVQDDEDYYDGPSDSEYESDDSNAENNPLNEYPDEETSEDEDGGSKTSSEEHESESSYDEVAQGENRRFTIFSEDEGPMYEEDVEDYDDINENEDDEESWKWQHR